ncbi:hypothetical protein [Tolypothrix sp. VBCCA 56010]|uniref:hypothetical protein n=1 Tax=Tolypothrix sp. VBCCA 56010 TaxID=3137731 RepID=UPI003D7E34C2
MLQPRNNLFKIAIPFFSLYIASILIIIIFGYIIKNQKQKEEYEKENKQLISWYQNLDETKNSSNFPSFIKQAQKKIPKILNSQKVTEKIQENIYYNSEGKLPEQPPCVEWNQNNNPVKACYHYTSLINFKVNNSNINIQSEKSDPVFQNFTQYMIDKIKPQLLNKTKHSDENTDNLDIFSKTLIKDLTKDKDDETNDNKDKYSNMLPYLKINNIYIFRKKTGFMLSYPLTGENYETKKRLDYQSRPWYRTTIGKYEDNYYPSDFINEDNSSGLTNLYIDINDKDKSNGIRTLWYKFKTTNNKTTKNEEYILCVDLFFDNSSQLSKQENLHNLLEESIKSGFNLNKNDNNWWIYLLLFSIIPALILSLIYELKIKDILLRRISEHNANNLIQIKLKLENQHYANRNADEEIEFTVEGQTKEINQSEQSTEANWSFNIQSIQVGIKKNQSRTKQREDISKYVFTKKYNLNMSQNKPQYRCIETWKVVLESKSGNIEHQQIGFFVANWNTSNSADIQEGLDIQSIYWEKEYEEYLGIIKEQLREHLLISDENELVAILDTNYSKRQNIPSFITGIDSLRKIISSSECLKQGKIVFSEVETLTELYKRGLVTVNSICTLHFIKKLVENKKLKDFFQTQVNERFLIEYKQDEFRDFYNSLDDESKSELINKSPFQIMVYQPNINNIVSEQDDFCII